MRSLLLLMFTAVTVASVAAEGVSRVKRSYYGYDYGYGVDGDFWYAGRILGIILGVSLLLLCCCLPCVCIAGIWFLGWFGIRQRRRQRAATSMRHSNQASPPLNGNVVSHPIHVQESPLPSRSRDYSGGGNVIYTAEDRYYSSSATPGDRRPDSYRASKF
ncbi:hypothetical protein RB195_005955 [Necator americanus]|uniref:Uncharacterized protein n=1 Tax=Necator americanus TaxID=51031 RepID=A0ABR1BU59_NECAM